MAYYTGTADSAPSLLAQIKVLVPAHGWEVVRDDDRPYGNYGVILQGAGAFFRLAVPEMASADSDNRHYQQVAQTYSGSDLVNPIGYLSTITTWDRRPYIDFPVIGWHLFVRSECIYLVIEGRPGQFSHLTLGRLDLIGGLSGGWFVSSTWLAFGTKTYPTRYEPVNQGLLHQSVSALAPYFPGQSAILIEDPDTGLLESFIPEGWTTVGQAGWRRWYCLSLTAVSNAAGTVATNYKVHPDTHRLWASADPRTGIVRLFPMSILWSGAQNRICYIGQPPAIAVCLLDFVQVGQVLTIDGEEWIIFPRRKRNLTHGGDRIGYAYRVN